MFNESLLAHKYLDGLMGIEVGGACHNPFNIPNCRNVDYSNKPSVYTETQMSHENRILKVDCVAYGQSLPFKDNSLDYILSSHVIEHFKDPICVLKSWMKIIKPGGYIFAIIPHKDRTFDSPRPVTTMAEHIERHVNNPSYHARSEDMHWSVWRTTDFIELCKYLELNIVEFHDSDDKVGNGFTVVLTK